MVVTIIFGAIACISTGILIGYRLQIKSIVHQVEYIGTHDTNKLISKQLATNELVELTDQLNELLNKYRRLVKEYDVKDTQLKETITNLSHDIRTPLTSLDGYFQLLKESTNPEEEERYYQIITSRIDSLKEILEQLFMFVKLQNDAYDIPITRCNMTQIVCDVLFSFYEDLKQKGMEPVVEIPEEVFYIKGNEASVKRILQNVMKNALDHGREHLVVQLDQQNERIRIQIKNTIERNEQPEVERVFQRFYKADEARSERSTGLGLAIASQLVERMNGSIKAKIEELSTQTYFTIEIQFPC